MAAKKITVVGAGKVGSAIAFIAARKGLGDIVLWNRDPAKAQGICLDILHSAAPLEFDVSIVGTSDFEKTRNSDVICISAGAARKEGQSRDDLLFSNAKIVGGLAEQLAKYSPNAVFVVVTNPLDVMCFVARQKTGFPKERVLGMAGALDTARFAAFIGMELNVPVQKIQATVLGSHGDLMVPVISKTTVNKKPLSQALPEKKIIELVERTRNAGAEIISLEKDSAFFAPAACVVQMAEAIIKDQKKVLPCSAFLEGEFGLSDVFLGVPVSLGKKGGEKIVEIKLSEDEQRALKKSAASIQTLIQTWKAGEKND